MDHRAAKTAFGWPRGALLEAYAGNRDEVIETSLEAPPLAVAVRALMSRQDQWSGTPTELPEARATIYLKQPGRAGPGPRQPMP
jgi:hypothetical protein